MHTFDALSALPAVLWWKPRQRGSIVVELHGLVSAQMGRGGPVAHGLVRALERFVLRRADQIIAGTAITLAAIGLTVTAMGWGGAVTVTVAAALFVESAWLLATTW